jgi:hypothetical protein
MATRHSRRDFVKHVGLGAAALAMPSLPAAAARRPNIIYILADGSDPHDRDEPPPGGLAWTTESPAATS